MFVEWMNEWVNSAGAETDLWYVDHLPVCCLWCQIFLFSFSLALQPHSVPADVSASRIFLEISIQTNGFFRHHLFLKLPKDRKHTQKVGLQQEPVQHSSRNHDRAWWPVPAWTMCSPVPALASLPVCCTNPKGPHLSITAHILKTGQTSEEEGLARPLPHSAAPAPCHSQLRAAPEDSSPSPSSKPADAWPPVPLCLPRKLGHWEEDTFLLRTEKLSNQLSSCQAMALRRQKFSKEQLQIENQHFPETKWKF